MDTLATGLKVYSLSKASLKTIKIPLPPKKEQNQISTSLMTMDIEIEQLETQLSKYKQMKAGMMQELLTGKKRLNLDLKD